MNFFALYFRVNLKQRPFWFDDFRTKYDEPYDLHITLIQPRYIEEAEESYLKFKIDKFLKENKLSEEDKELVFDSFSCEKELDGKYTCMLIAQDNNTLINFQKGLRENLKRFNKYVDEITKQYEIDFRPHITIGRNIAQNDIEEVKSYFKSGYSTRTLVNELVLPVVKNNSIKEAQNPDNQTIYRL